MSKISELYKLLTNQDIKYVDDEEINKRLNEERRGVVSPIPLTAYLPSIKDTKKKKEQTIEELIGSVLSFYQSKVPNQTPLEEYYPAGQYIDDIVSRGESLRPGVGVLAALQMFFESTGGRNTSNLFGVLPSGNSLKIDPVNAIDYQFGPSVLGGGANKNMNILNTKDPLTEDRIRQLYKSYDPPGAYVDSLIEAWNNVM